MSKLLTGLFLILLGSSSYAQRRFGAPGAHFQRAFIVIFENNEYSTTIKAPFFKSLADRGANFSNMFAISRPSQPNYIALTSGTTNGVRTDNNVDLNLTNIIDQLEARGLNWRVYAEDYPENCFTGATSGRYARKHNPFISYLNIQKNPVRCANIVNASRLQADIARGPLPNFVFYVPDNRNSAHDTNIAYADRWYAQAFGPLVANPTFMQDTAFITTFDEGGFIFSKNQIYTSVVGPMVKPGTYADSLTLYSVLKMLQENWNLGTLGRDDVRAPSIPNIWR